MSDQTENAFITGRELNEVGLLVAKLTEGKDDEIGCQLHLFACGFASMVLVNGVHPDDVKNILDHAFKCATNPLIDGSLKAHEGGK